MYKTGGELLDNDHFNNDCEFQEHQETDDGNEFD